MARPREFDEEKVLDQTLQTFWERGFDGTSISDLVDATGLSRASLYGAFGDKEALFRRALEHYHGRAATVSERVLAAPTAVEALRRYFDHAIDSSCPKQGPRGCFLLLSASGSPADHPIALELYAATVAATERMLEQVLRRGQASGELRGDLDAKTVAKLLTVTTNGLSLAARTGRSKEELRKIARQSVVALTAP